MTTQTQTTGREIETTEATEGWKATPEWILAGKATFTVHNDKGEHYTFKVVKGKREGVWFVQATSAPDGNYGPVGILRADGTITKGRTTNGNDTSKAREVAQWTIKRVWSGKAFPEGYAVNHKGCCGRCGKTLTRPEGVDPKGYRFGYGETCYGKILADRARRDEAIQANPQALVAPKRAPQGDAGSPQTEATAPTAEEIQATYGVVREAMRGVPQRGPVAMVVRPTAMTHPANRVETFDQRWARINREMREDQESRVGINPLY